MDLINTPNSTINSRAEMIEDKDDSEEMRTLWVSRIQEKVDEEVLFELFMNSGPVSKVTIPRNKQTNKLKTFAFVLFEHKASVQYAIQQMADVMLYGQKIIMKPYFSRKRSGCDVSKQEYEVNQNVVRKPFDLEGNNSMKTPLELTENQNFLRTNLYSSHFSNIKVSLFSSPRMDVTKRNQDFIPNDGGVLQKRDSLETNGRWILSAEEQNVLNRKDDHREQSRDWNKRSERSERNKDREVDLRDKVNRCKLNSRRDEKYSYEKSQSRSQHSGKDDTHPRDRSRSSKRHKGKNGSSQQHDTSYVCYEAHSRERSRSRRRHKEREDRKDDGYLRRRSSPKRRYRGARERDNGRNGKRDRSKSRSRHRETRDQKRKYENDIREKYDSKALTETKYEFSGPLPVEGHEGSINEKKTPSHDLEDGEIQD